MNKYYSIQYYNKLQNLWISYNLIKYKSLQEVKKEVNSYKEHKLGVKLRIQKTEIIK